MSEFDPTKPALVHDQLNDWVFEFDPIKHRANYERYAEPWRPRVIEWDGLLLDGWKPIARH
jgi:hypothetical protein